MDSRGAPEPRELLARALIEIRTLKARVKELEESRREPIAIVGYGCRFPGAPDPEAFWRLLRDGVDAVREVPRDRFDIDAWYHPDPDEPGKIYTRSAAFLDQVDGFDAGFFGLSPREVLNLSPQQRLLLEVTWEALEDANLPPAELYGSATGVFVGQCGFDEGPWNATGPAKPEEIDLYSLTGSTLSITAGRLSYLLGVNGPSLVVDTACSSSLVALQLACQSLRRHDCERALVGGVHVLTSPSIMLGLCRIKALAPDGRCKTFDASADGYGRGEGCGVVLLRRLSDALAAGDRIHAVIRGVAINQDGASGGLTVPSGPSQSAVIRQAMADGGVEPAQLDYVEAHGTGTSLGDPIEMRALQAVWSAHTRERPLHVGSVKSNIGHLEAAAGIAGLLKVVLAVERRVIPPSLHFHAPNPHIDWGAMAVVIPTEGMPWPDPGRRALAGVSSFGLGGTNVHVVVEEAPGSKAVAATSLLRSHPVLLLSGRDENALRAAATQLDAHLRDHADADLGALAHAAATGRTHFAERAAIAAGDVASARAALQALAQGSAAPGVVRGRRDEARLPEIGFVFPGADTTPPGACELLERPPAALKTVLERCAVDPAAKLPALLAWEVALAAMWRSFGVVPDFVMGQGIGEVAAAIDAGVLELKDGLQWATALARRDEPGGAEAWRRLVTATPLTRPIRKLISQLSGAEAGEEIATPAYWLQALRDPAARAHFASLRDAQERPSPRLLLEVGPPSRLGAAIATSPQGRFLRSELVDALARLHVQGAAIDWTKVEGGADRRAATLPTYPFQRTRYPLHAATSPTGAAGAKGPAWHDWLYEPTWRASDPVVAPGAAGRWLVLMDRAGFGDALAQALTARGASCVKVPADEAASPTTIARELGRLGGAPLRGVVHLLGLDAASGDLDPATLSRGARSACESALHWQQALARTGARDAPRLWIATRGAVAANGPDLPEPLQATLWGLGRSFALEAAEHWGGLIDLDPTTAANAAADLLARHLLSSVHEERVALRGGVRLVERIARCSATPSAPLQLRADATWLVTGGLGAIGLALAERLAARGARHLVLLGRKAPSAAAQSRLDALAKKGCDVHVEAADVASEADLRRVLDAIARRGPPLRGVFHSAGVVEDVALARQTWSQFETALASKLLGAAHLHRLTLGLELEYFVLFSSAVSLLGSVGQANYAAASGWLDALAWHRRARNLPALSVQWGAWSEAGLASSEPILRGLEQRGFGAMANAPALDALEWAMAQRRPQVAVVPVAWPRFLEALPSQSPTSLFADLASQGVATVATASGPEPAALRGELAACSPLERRRLLRKHVADQVAAVLRLPPEPPLDEEIGFFQLGMNSLTTVELRKRVGKPLGLAVSATMVFDHPTVRALASRLEQELFGATTEEPAPAPAALSAVADDDVSRLLDQELLSLKGLRLEDPRQGALP